MKINWNKYLHKEQQITLKKLGIFSIVWWIIYIILGISFGAFD